MTQSMRFAVVLSGCGHLDGSEIQEAVCTLLAIAQHGGVYQCFAPDVAQRYVTDHLARRQVAESRNVLVESARIARGQVLPLNAFDEKQFDALVFPGGFGAAANLSDYIENGPDCSVHPDAARAIRAMHRTGKPIGALCIAPVLLAKVLETVTLTVGGDAQTDADLRSMGATPQPATHGQIVVDRNNKVVTTPCYMLDARIDQIHAGAAALIEALMQLSVPQK